MIKSTFNKDGPKTIYTLFPKNKKFRIKKENLKYLSKEYLDFSDNSEYINTDKNDNRKTKLTERNLPNSNSNSYSKYRINFFGTNTNWNYNYNNNITRPNYDIGPSTSINFWKSSNNNKFKLNNFIKKNKKSSKMRTNNFMNMNKLKEDRESSTEQKYALNSKLFEQYINQYEEKIRKALLDIGVNPDKCKDTNKDYFSNQYDKYFNNLPILNNNNNTDHKRSNDMNNFRLKYLKPNKMFSSFNSDRENTNYLEEKEYITENINNNIYDNNNVASSNNSNNGNNNIILKNSFNKNFASNLDSTNINTKSHTINSVYSVKGKDNKKLISV